MECTVRPMCLEEMELMVDYFLQASPEFLIHMGADPDKLPQREDWLQLLEKDMAKPLKNRDFFYITWLLNEEPVGHSNINKISFGKEAAMHLHVWNQAHRVKGLGSTCVWKSLAFYFDRFQLNTLYCEPNAHNPGPNKTLKKLGFEFIEQVEMVPGWINFLQPINRYRLTRAAFHEISKENEAED